MFAQESNPVVEKSYNGEVTVTDIDPLGATVKVVYNRDLEKIYQERVSGSQTTFARFEDGNVVEYGTITKPIIANSDEMNFEVHDK